MNWLMRLWHSLVGEPGQCRMCHKPSNHFYCDDCLDFLNEW